MFFSGLSGYRIICDVSIMLKNIFFLSSEDGLQSFAFD